LERPARLPIFRAVQERDRQTIDATTRYCAVFGHPVKHSASPAFQNAGIQELGLNWRYVACDVHPDNLREAIEGARRMKFIGLNLTVPHKLLAVKLVDVLDMSARTWGAVNTIRFEARDARGRWQPLRTFADGAIPEDIRSVGFNTDADAIVRAIREDLGLNVRDKRILVLGAGGAGRTAALKLAESGARELFLVNRTRAKVAALAREIRRRFPRVAVTIGYPDTGTRVDLALNATSLGLRADDALPFDGVAFSLKQARTAYDMIYRPAETPFLKLAKRAGCRTANGLGMLLYQGTAALEIWTGRRAPVAVMRRALERNVYER
jgi:shikimate dehydrogenase